MTFAYGSGGKGFGSGLLKSPCPSSFFAVECHYNLT